MPASDQERGGAWGKAGRQLETPREAGSQGAETRAREGLAMGH